MKLLALDTAMAACSAAVIDTTGNRLLAASWRAMERGHAEALAPMVEQVMRDSGSVFSELDRIAVTTGPGTFTGVRIGLAMARGLGLALGIPVAGIGTLAAIAANADGVAGPLVVAADARKDEVYVAVFGADGSPVSAPKVLRLTEAARLAPPYACLLGTAADALAAAGRGDLQRSTAGDLPVAAHFAWAAATLPINGTMPAPVYLRAPDATPQATSPRPPPLTFRPVSAGEAAVVASIHAECFDRPWTAAEFAQLIAMPGAIATLAVEGGEPVGFILLRKALDEAEVVTIATRPFARRRGIARRLLDHQLAELHREGVVKAFLEVAAGNEAARALYAACGFAEAGLRRGYYQRDAGQREDAMVLRKDLIA
jgi:tRNA threonylcarbamoyladenosine biosynthesis protein TsaB